MGDTNLSTVKEFFPRLASLQSTSEIDRILAGTVTQYCILGFLTEHFQQHVSLFLAYYLVFKKYFQFSFQTENVFSETGMRHIFRSTLNSRLICKNYSGNTESN